MKAVNILVFLVLIAAVIVVVAQYSGKQTGATQAAAEKEDAKPKAKKEAPRLEEKFGFTGEQVGP